MATTDRKPSQVSCPNGHRGRDNHQGQRRPGHSRLHPRWHDQETKRSRHRPLLTRAHALVAIRVTALLERMHDRLQTEGSVPSYTGWGQSPLRTTPRTLHLTGCSILGSPQNWHYCHGPSRQEQHETDRGPTRGHSHQNPLPRGSENATPS